MTTLYRLKNHRKEQHTVLLENSKRKQAEKICKISFDINHKNFVVILWGLSLDFWITPGNIPKLSGIFGQTSANFVSFYEFRTYKHYRPSAESEIRLP